jgi:hypothetical protein
MQQLDPLAEGTSWDVAIFISIVTWVYAVTASFLTYRSAVNQGFLIAALVTLTAAIAVHLWSSAPRHAPYTRLKYSVVVFLAITAGSFQIASDGGAVSSMFFHWGPISIALLFASASGYRSLPDQYYAGLAAVVTMFAVLGLDSLHHPIPFGSIYFCVSGVALLAIVVLGQASYTFKASRMLMSWQKTVDETAVAPSQVSDVDIVGPLTRQAREFLVEILDKGRISDADNQKAQQLSSSIRNELVMLSDQTWVERLGATLHDPEKALTQLDLSAQSAIAALMTGLGEAGITNVQLSVRVDPETRRLSCIVQGEHSSDSYPEAKMRTYISAFLRVMYVVFEDVRFINNDGQVNVMFYYAP